MKLGLARVLALAVALALAACATGPRLTPPTSAIPDLRGTWKGTWGGTPLALLVIDQQGTVPVGGVTLGPWSLSGDALPALSGVLTFQSAGAAVSVNARGRFGDWHARLTLVLDGFTPNGAQIVLTELTPDRLRGTGTSLVSWEPGGPVELRRRGSRPTASRSSSPGLGDVPGAHVVRRDQTPLAHAERPAALDPSQRRHRHPVGSQARFEAHADGVGLGVGEKQSQRAVGRM